jgi:copper chaperone CopZ
MLKKVYEMPSLYGDHHVIEVRNLLLELDGVKDVYASSAFQAVEVTYDPEKINDLEIALKLDQAGYLGEWTLPIETGISASQEETQQPFFRHTSTYQQTKQIVSFAQSVTNLGRPLWPCPGMGVLNNTVMED